MVVENFTTGKLFWTCLDMPEKEEGRVFESEFKEMITVMTIIRGIEARTDFET